MSAVPEHMQGEVQRLVNLFDSMTKEESKEGVEVYTKAAWHRVARDAVKHLRDLLETDH